MGFDEMHRWYAVTFVICATLSCEFAYTADTTGGSARPNILLIVADDLGYSDIGPFGGEIRTPNLDGLAKGGMLFSDFHTAPTCSPTRSMLLSGTDNHLAGLGTMGELLAPNQKGKPGYEGHLSDRVVSIATLLRDAGYFTCMTGKWHLGEDVRHDPSRRGFQKSYTMLQGGASHFDDEWMMSANYTPIYRENGVRVHVPKGFYSTEFYTSKLIEYLGDRKEERPFFAYLSFTAPHDPLHAPDDWIDKYKGQYDAGYDAIRQSRLKRMKQTGVLDPEAIPYPPLPTVPTWAQLTDEHKKFEARKMEVYAAMVENVDHHLGRLFRHLKSTGQWDNTLVIFMSDNGANGSEMHQYPQTDKDWIERNSDNRYENLGRPYSRIAQGPGWAQVSMSPYRLFKGFLSEGGIRVPLIVHGPTVSEPGRRADAFCHVMDVAATILEISRTPHPGRSYKSRETEPLRGRSLIPVLQGNSKVVHENDIMNWELFGFRAVRNGDYKLLWLPRPFGSNDWQLYDLAKDPGELQDLSRERPELRRQMAKAWERYAQDTGVVLPSVTPLD